MQGECRGNAKKGLIFAEAILLISKINKLEKYYSSFMTISDQYLCQWNSRSWQILYLVVIVGELNNKIAYTKTNNPQ